MPMMGRALEKRFTFDDLRAARVAGHRVPMLTCYDFSTARLMQEAGVPALLVGDSAANVILGHDSTVPVSLSFMIELTAAVRRGAPLALVVADMPFGSYQASVEEGARSVMRMVKRSGCDCVKLEVGPGQLELVRRLGDAGVPTMAHLGLLPQTAALGGGYRFQGRTAEQAREIVDLAVEMERAGAVAILLEAVPPEVGAAVVERTGVPVIGCGAGPACHGHVVVTHDAIGLSGRRPKFVPALEDLAEPMRQRFGEYVRRVTAGEYPAAEHCYVMPQEERERFGGLE
jgi:3-methyl-2-oxobutanoate hydroxymethyltransferase